MAFTEKNVAVWLSVWYTYIKGGERMSQTIGEKIREIRKARGLTQKELGEKAGIAEPTIRRYELGKLNPKIETVKKIADALGVEAWTLVDPAVAGQSGAVEIPAGLPDETRAYLERLASERAQVLGMLKLEQEREKAIMEQMMDDFQHLNDEGQTKAAERVRELTEIARYRNDRAYALDQYKAEHAAPDAAGPAEDDAATDGPKE